MFFSLSLGISIHDSKLSYFDFLRALDDGRTFKYQQRQKQAAPPVSFAVLRLEQTLIKIKEIVATSYDLLYKVSFMWSWNIFFIPFLLPGWRRAQRLQNFSTIN